MGEIARLYNSGMGRYRNYAVYTRGTTAVSVTDGFEDGIASWTGSGGGTWSSSTAQARTGTKSMKWTLAVAGAEAVATYSVSVQKGCLYRVGVWVKPIDFNGTIRLYLTSYTAAEAVVLNTNFGSAAGNTEAVPATLQEKWIFLSHDYYTALASNVATLKARLVVEAGATGTCFFDDFEVETLADPRLDVVVQSPRYREKIFTGGSKTISIGARAHGNSVINQPNIDNMNIRASMSTDVENLATTDTSPGQSSHDILTLDAANVPNGTYTLDVQLLDKWNGYEYDSTSFDLTISDDAVPTVYVDSNGRCVRNGSVVFPCGFSYAADIDLNDLSEYDNIRDNFDNITLVSVTGIISEYQSGAANVTTFHAALNTRGLAHLFLLGNTRVGLNNAISDPSGMFEDLVDTYKDDAGLWGWVTADEASGYWLDQHVTRYNYIKTADPNHPCYQNLSGGQQIYEEHVNVTDILSCDYYPVWHADLNPPETLATAFAAFDTQQVNVKNALKGGKCQWAFIECAAFAGSTTQPTAAQILLSCFLALIRGARGLMFYEYQSMLDAGAGQLTAMQSVDSMLGEVAAFAKGTDTAGQTTCNNANIRLFTRTSSDGMGTVMIMAANPTAGAINGTYTLGAGVTGSSVSDGVPETPGTATITAGAFTYNIGAYGYALFTVVA